MIREVKGDLLKCNSDIIAHQVNCKGVMGAGVAAQIRKQLMSSYQYDQYQALCRTLDAKELLGTNRYTSVRGTYRKYVCHMFGEDKPTGRGLDTDYEALRKCLTKLECAARKSHMSVAIPGYLGCGLAGGDWEYVFTDIIKPIFEESEVNLTIVYFDDAYEKLVKSFENLQKTDMIQKTWHGFPEGTSVKQIQKYLRFPKL